MVITVFGLGFVGLTTSLGFAKYGHTVYGVEVNEDRLNTIKSGKLPFLEPGLDEALKCYLNDRFHPIGIDQLKMAIPASDRMDRRILHTSLALLTRRSRQEMRLQNIRCWW